MLGHVKTDRADRVVNIVCNSFPCRSMPSPFLFLSCWLEIYRDEIFLLRLSTFVPLFPSSAFPQRKAISLAWSDSGYDLFFPQILLPSFCRRCNVSSLLPLLLRCLFSTLEPTRRLNSITVQSVKFRESIQENLLISPQL